VEGGGSRAVWARRDAGGKCIAIMILRGEEEEEEEEEKERGRKGVCFVPNGTEACVSVQRL